MGTYLLRRLVGTIPVMVLISLLVFLLIQAAPGDPTLMLLGEDSTAEDIAEARERWGLDQPVYVQYIKFFMSAAQGNLGRSFKYDEPVLDVIINRIPATLELAAASLIIAVIFAIPLGVWAAAKPNSWVDNTGTTFGLFGISMPSFWFGIMLILLFAGILNILPSAGRDTYGIAGPRITGFYILDSIEGNWELGRGARRRGARVPAGPGPGLQHAGDPHAGHPVVGAGGHARGLRWSRPVPRAWRSARCCGATWCAMP